MQFMRRICYSRARVRILCERSVHRYQMEFLPVSAFFFSVFFTTKQRIVSGQNCRLKVEAKAQDCRTNGKIKIGHVRLED